MVEPEVPCWTSAVVGRHGSDEVLLGLAADLEEATGWTARRPA